MNVGGINTLDNSLVFSTASNKVSQDAFSQILVTLFQNIQNASLGEGTNIIIPSELSNNSKQTSAKSDITNIIFPALSCISNNDSTENLREMEKWINEIVPKGKDDNAVNIPSIQENTNIDVLIKSIIEALNCDKGQSLGLNAALNTKVIPVKDISEENAKYGELTKSETEKLSSDTERVGENMALPVTQEVPEENAEDVDNNKSKTVETIINNLSTAIAQIIQINNFPVNEGKVLQKTSFGENIETAEISGIGSKDILKPESLHITTKTVIQNERAFNESMIKNNESTVIGKDTNKDFPGEKITNTQNQIIDEVIREVQEQPNNTRIIEKLVNQIIEKVQLKNPGKEIKVEDVLAFIKEADYKKIIDNLNTINSFSKNNLFADVSKVGFTNVSQGVQAAADTIASTDNIKALEQSEENINSLTVNLSNEELNPISDPKILLPVLLNSDIKLNSIKSSNAVKISSNISGSKSDNVQKNDDLQKNGLKPIFKDKSSLEGIEDSRGSVNHYPGKAEVISKNEFSMKNPEDVKVFTKHENIIEAAVKGFKSLKLPEINELRVKLKPDELGEIVVKVVLEKGQISGNITAEKRDVVNILQNQVDNLKQELKNNNVNVNSISVNIGSEQGGSSHQGYFNQNEKREKRNFENAFTSDTGEEQDEGFEVIA